MIFLSNEEKAQYTESKARFEAYYNKVLLPLLEQKEEFRLRCVGRFKKLAVMALVILPIFIGVALFCQIDVKTDILWNVFLALCAIFIYVLRAPFVEYRHKIKNDVMGEFIKFFNGFSYIQGKRMDEHLMSKSLIFPDYDEYTADDCFFGKYDDVEVSVYEQTLKEIRHGAKGQRYKVTVFEGISVELGMNKPFKGQTIVIKDLGIFNCFKSFKHMERVKLEDVVFEKEFEVFSDNQIEARYLLTTAFMERVLELKKLYAGKTIQISFYNKHILINIDTNEDMFEACSFFKSNINQARFLRVFDEFWTIFSIINILKLNRHIGM